jgi:hypothetical protein
MRGGTSGRNSQRPCPFLYVRYLPNQTTIGLLFRRQSKIP